MAISLVGSASAEATTVSIPAHQVGDIILIFAFRDGSTTQPTLPSDFTSAATQAGTSCCGRLGVKVADTTSETSGTWTSATDLVCHVYRGSAGVGAVGVTAAVSATFTYPTVALIKTDSTSWVAGFAGHRSIDGAVGTAPTGMTNRQNRAGATADAGSHDTNGGVSSWPTGKTAAYGGTSSGWVAITAEILSPNPKIETLTDDFTTADSGKWNNYGTNPSVNAGRLQIQATAGYSFVDTTPNYSLQDSFLLCEAVQRPISTANANVGLQDPSGSNRLAFGWDTANIKFVENANGTVTEPAIAYDSVAHRWWRITESGGIVNWDTSPDGITWTNRRTKTWALTQIGYMHAFVDCGGVNDTTIPLLLDNFNLPPTTDTTDFFVMF